MPQNAAEIKERIVSFIENNGPSLPVHIAQSAGQSILFTSAFLSELLSDKMLKISNMRVGSSAIHFLPGQEPQLEKFSNYLKSKEKEAYLLLKEKKFLKDSEQEPAIRVALRNIKDFAFPFENNGEVYWRYLTIDESEFNAKTKHPAEKRQEEAPEKIPEKKREEKTDEEKREEKTKPQDLEIFDKETSKEKEPGEKPQTKTAKISKTKKTSSKSKSESARNKFFNKAKDFLAGKGIEILGIEEIAINKIIFRAKDNPEENSEEYLIVAYNKKRVTEEDIVKAYKKAEDLSLEYKILSLGGTLKKTENLINASKMLKGIEKIE